MEERIYREAVRQYGTPCYIFDLDSFRERITAAQKLLGECADICYAMKANPFLTETAAGQADHLEVCSPGEFAICERVCVPMEKVVLSGVNKEEKDIRDVVERHGNRITYTVESMLQLECLERAAGDFLVKIPVLLRVSSGNQFGLDEKLVKEILSNRSQYPFLMFKGLQYFSGTQKKRMKVLKEELQYLDQLLLELEESCGFEAEVLEFGPGLFVEYFPKEETAENFTLLQEFCEVLPLLRFRKKITLELGRYLAAFCGAYLTTIVDQKVNKGSNYCIVDGGIHQVNYYGQTMAMKIPQYRHLKGTGCISAGGEEKMWNICGSLCTVNDILVKNLPLRSARTGDVLVFENTGAYSVTEGMSLFLCRDLPKILYYDKVHGLRIARNRVETNTLLMTEE